MFRSFIFDKDGVLVETEEAKIRSYYNALKEAIPHEIPGWKKYYDWHNATLTGESRVDVVEGIIEEYPSLNAALLESKEYLKEKWKSGVFDILKYKEAKKEIKMALKGYNFDAFTPELLLLIYRLIKYADIPLEDKCKPIAPVCEFLQSLRENRVPTALITESELKRTKQELAHIRVDINSFEVVMCKDKIYCRGKERESPGNKREMYALMSEEFTKKYGECVAIEDTYSGMDAASRGGVPCFLPREGKFTKEVVTLLKLLCMPSVKKSEPSLIVSIDFGGTHTTVGFNEELLLCFPRSFKDEDHEKILDFLKKMCAPSAVRALGIGLATTMVPAPGMERRVSEYSSKFKILSQVGNGHVSKIQELWTKEVGVPVFILNDGEAAALAEHRRGGGRGYRNVLVITLGTSIGVGFIFQNRLHIGPYSSRASHIILEPDGEWDSGDNHQGCWKVLAGIDAMHKLARNMGLCENEDNEIDLKEIAKKARKGDRKSQLFYEFYAERVARGIAIIAGAVPFECVVVGGGIAKAGDVLFDPLRARLQRGDILDNSVASALKIVPAQCKEPVVMGAKLHAEEIVPE